MLNRYNTYSLIILSGNRQDVYDLTAIIDILNDSCGSAKPLTLQQKQEIRAIFESFINADATFVELEQT